MAKKATTKRTTKTTTDAADKAPVKVPRPSFILGDPRERGSSLRPIYGPEDGDGRRSAVGYVDQSSPYFDLLTRAILFLKAQ